uniref:Immunoglobulin domain-containing protein n=1 Tax=Fundulus heteroclitus TaxID=8078 RepID=A0A3Q2SUK4_FUNHE
ASYNHYLCILFQHCGSWVSVSVFEFHTIVVQPREDVTLRCSNLSSFPVHIFWFKLVNGSNASIISSMNIPECNASLREGFQNGKFTMTSNRTNLFLSITQLDFSDSGLYICGTSLELKSGIFSATYLQVQVDAFVVPFWILCATSIFLLIVIIYLAAKNRRTQTVCLCLQNPDSDTLNYAALNFVHKPKRNRMTRYQIVTASAVTPSLCPASAS